MWRRAARRVAWAGALGAGGYLAANGYYYYYHAPVYGNETWLSSYFESPRIIPYESLEKSRHRFNSIPSREQQIQSLQSNQPYDLIVIGAGATGSGIALDATTRGLSVAVIEKDDFSSGTSSRSTKLIHGGVRYLQKAVLGLDYDQYKMVKEALYERMVLLTLEPHLTYQLPIMLPIYKFWPVPYYSVGTKMYDILAGRQGITGSYYLSHSKALERFPMLKKEKLVGAMVYYDGAHNDSRTNICIALTAAAYGAHVANHVEVIDLIRSQTNKIIGVKVKDKFTSKEWEITGKAVINATGPFVDRIREMDEGKSVKKLVVPSSGIHVVLPEYYAPSDMGLLDPKTADGRVIFFLPWEGHTISGTTDTLTSITDFPEPLEKEISFVLKEVSRYLSKDIKVRRGEVLAAWAGIRPLIIDPTKVSDQEDGQVSTQALVRNHLILKSPNNLVTIAGGKWTTYREMAKETVDLVIDQFKLQPKISNDCVTQHVQLIGAHEWSSAHFIHLIQEFGYNTKIAKYLSHTYGDKAAEIFKYEEKRERSDYNHTTKFWKPISEDYPYTESEIKYCIDKEYARTAIDILARRTRLAFLNANVAMDALPRVVQVMASQLNWDDKRIKQELVDSKKFLLTMGLNDTTARAYFNKKEILNFRDVFDALDRNGDGQLEAADFTEIFKLMEEEISHEEVQKILFTVDLNKNERIEFNEFLELMALVKKSKAQNSNPKEKRNSFARLAEISFDDLKKRIPTERSGGGL